ncbi:alpha-glucosidase (family GH31 glycosyl hydrolase) [Caldalkalibacillus uzonensis]|uniref:Alpha-glucosidase (Family GH31 glycosyl hydrolase) n=1 Tax=Caldalkalibacillus uzonensis TaxID=353224 RepID=A0ABU0CQ11_9BACI|nr:alpha-glucosidase (family GH31 glycosyl hydrolase) [Caldalkalibacillus uzonensis]
MLSTIRRRKTVALIIVLLIFFLTSMTVLAIDGVWHHPYGIDDLYEVKETERFPRDPVAGENVYIHLTTWPVMPGQATWITWTKNGIAQPDIGGEWKYNSGNNSYWVVDMGSFEKGDHIQYTVHANKDGTNEKTIGPFEFTVVGWESIQKITGVTDYGNRIVLEAVPDTGNMKPKINLSFTNDEVFRVQMSPTGLEDHMASGLSNYTVSESTSQVVVETAKLKIIVEKDPYLLKVYDQADNLIARGYDPSLQSSMTWLTDGDSIITKVQDHFYTPENEQFFGFGERYNSLGQRGRNVDTYVYNQYLNQDERTYMAIPFFVNTNGYGIFVNSTFYSQFRLATDRSDMYSFTVNTAGAASSMLDYYFIHGTDLKDVIANYTDITGKPTLPPKFAFGLWMSANEWSSQDHVTNVLNQVRTHDIAAAVMVLEQWSDEHTFYIWNDAQYQPKHGSESFRYEDFTFPADGRWPDPKGMVQELHDEGIKVLLWQIPVQKWTPYPYEQADNDEAYMLEQGYAVGNGSNGAYRIPDGTWFGNSLLLDFTNPEATAWWMSKLDYLFDDIGIDGFKTDGGEMVWGRWNTFANGKKGDEMRNQYPNEYIRAYYEHAKSKKEESMLFSRAGTHGVQQYPGFWAGDQDSTFNAYQQAIRAGLTANISGVPFWSWDLAGFTGPYPSSELYKRSTAMAAFSPIMQFHSEKANPSPSEERSPWNAATRTGDETIIDTFRFYVNTRMNLLPYIYSEAKKTSETGIPLMRAMAIEFPEDTITHDLTWQYMFGDYLLIAPIVNEGEKVKSIYLPEGEWIDFWWGAQRPGQRWITYYAGVNDIPVFVRAGSIIPMNLNENYELGGSIGNELDRYQNLIFRIYPKGTTAYDWYDDVNGQVKTITVTEDYPSQKVTVSMPPIDEISTLMVFTSMPNSVEIESSPLDHYTDFSSFTTATQGWYYDKRGKFAFVKVPADTATRTIHLKGVHKAEYEAEFATQHQVGTNDNHSGYYGTGFVDQFADVGNYIEFDVLVEQEGAYTLDIRYSSAGGAASRGIYVNDVKLQELSLPQTSDWDTWDVASLTVSLRKGYNTIKIQYDNGNVHGINVDHIAIRP